jgi:hypothetical protein
MTKRAGVGWCAGVAAVAVVTASVGTARAHGADDVERPSPPTGHEGQAPPVPAPSAYASPAPTASAETAESTEEGEHEGRFKAGLDLVLGWGRVPFAVQNLPSGGNPNITYTRADQTQSNVQSFLLGASAEVGAHVGVGVRIPFTFAGFNPDGSAARATTDFGNVELEGEYAAHLGRGLRLVGALGVALPTAQGDEIPATLNQTPSSQVDASALDRWSLSRSAMYARGYEDNALFEPHRLGIVPKVSLLYRIHGLSIEPWVKVENLVATSTALAESYVGELVGGVRVGYWVHRQFELALKGWVNGGFAGADEDKHTSASMEPQLVLRFGSVWPYAGVIIPLAGPPQDNSFVGVRVGIAAGF